MNWLDTIGGVLQQYSSNTDNSHSAERDFDRVSQVAPRQTLSSGIAEAFRSNQTPAWESMLGSLFRQSSGTQRADILNTLLATAGPALLSGVLTRGGSSPLSGLAGILQGGERRITPEQAEQIPPEAVEEVAREAEKQDPTVVDRISDFYSEHPGLVKTLGAAALAVAMSRMAKQERGIF